VVLSCPGTTKKGRAIVSAALFLGAKLACPQVAARSTCNFFDIRNNPLVFFDCCVTNGSCRTSRPQGNDGSGQNGPSQQSQHRLVDAESFDKGSTLLIPFLRVIAVCYSIPCRGYRDRASLFGRSPSWIELYLPCDCGLKFSGPFRTILDET